MDWQRVAADDLRRYETMQRSLISIPTKIRVLEDKAKSIKAGISDAEPVIGGSSRAEDRLISNIQERERLRLNYSVAKRLVGMIDGALSLLTDKERRVLERFYILQHESGYVERLCNELGYEKTRIYELKNIALKKFTIAMYGIADL